MSNKGSLLLASLAAATLMIAAGSCKNNSAIDRDALIARNNPHVTTLDTLSSLTVGNGGFAFTVDVTGLQSFPEYYSNGVPLGTQSDWGWHSFANPEGLRFEETLKEMDFGRGHKELYAAQFKEPGRQHDATEWFRSNPHRLHLGCIGFEGISPSDITDIDQTLDMMNGEISSSFSIEGKAVRVLTVCDPERDMVAAKISTPSRLPVAIRLPYPTGKHADDACDWSADSLHLTELIETTSNSAILRHSIDSTIYYISLTWDGASAPVMTGRNKAVITPSSDEWSFTAEFSPVRPESADGLTFAKSQKDASDYWQKFWREGGVVDFSECTDPRAPELERRVVLSQYLLAAQCAGSTPPQETGLTYNSWFGKFHMEMIWWHQAQFALYGHGDLLARTLPWYDSVKTVARDIAARQGFKGVRWMKMTDPSGTEAPSNVGSYLIWQQPHIIYLAELLYRQAPDDAARQKILDQYYDLVQQSADFMADFVEYDGLGNRYIIRGAIPAQETLKAAETVNPPFELSYWHFGLDTAQKWRERKGEGRDLNRDEIIDKLSPLATGEEGLYLAAETAADTYKDIRFTSDHMAVLAALGVLPKCDLVRTDTMGKTFDWIYDNWNWGKTWGWDYPTTAMCAVRLGEPEKAIDALLMDKRTNTYLPNGHNYQDSRLRCYLPGNGGLLTAVALMTAGWDGCEVENPGFPKNGKWNVRWEGIKPLP